LRRIAEVEKVWRGRNLMRPMPPQLSLQEQGLVLAGERVQMWN
jgi:hypothetical protein